MLISLSSREHDPAMECLSDDFTKAQLIEALDSLRFGVHGSGTHLITIDRGTRDFLVAALRRRR